MLICGTDEAGRGPIIGPLVMAGVLLDENGENELKRLRVRDSKLILPTRRKSLFKSIIKISKGYKILVIPAQEIDEALKSEHLNLNWLEANKTAEILNELKPERAYIDSPSPNNRAYQRYLAKLLDHKIELVVEHKADVKYVSCAAASILAKVTRDEEVEKIREETGQDLGSGYLTDPKTKKFLEENFESHKDLFRQSWLPYKRIKHLKDQKRLHEF